MSDTYVGLWTPVVLKVLGMLEKRRRIWPDHFMDLVPLSIITLRSKPVLENQPWRLLSPHCCKYEYTSTFFVVLTVELETPIEQWLVQYYHGRLQPSAINNNVTKEKKLLFTSHVYTTLFTSKMRMGHLWISFEISPIFFGSILKQNCFVYFSRRSTFHLNEGIGLTAIRRSSNLYIRFRQDDKRLLCQTEHTAEFL